MGWLETYRGTVHRWEVDNVDHFTVAYYFARFEDATLALLHAMELDAAAMAGIGKTAATLECRVSYLRELRVGDILHLRSGVIDVRDDGLLIGHQVFDSGDGTLCTTVVQRVALVHAGQRAPLALDRAQRAAARPFQVEWDTASRGTGEPAMAGPDPGSADGFIDTARDTIKPWEVDTRGEAAFPAFIHRFSAANAQAIAAFGMTPGYMKTERRGFSTFEFWLHFPGALRAGDPARVTSAVVHVGNSSLRLLHRMTNAITGRLVATLLQSGVHLDLEARRPAPLPPALGERARSLLAGGAPRSVSGAR